MPAGDSHAAAGTQTKPSHPGTGGRDCPPAWGTPLLGHCHLRLVAALFCNCAVGTKVPPTRAGRVQPVSAPAQRGAARPQKGLSAGTRGVPGSFIRLQWIPERWRTASALRLSLCRSNSQGTWTVLQVCPPAPPHPHWGTPPLSQRGLGAVLEEGEEGGRHDPELSRSQEMSPKRSRGSCIQVLCSVCGNSRPSILDIPGTARSHTLVPASALGQG